MPGTVKSELLPDADRSHKCDCQEKVSWKRNLPLDKSHFITENGCMLRGQGNEQKNCIDFDDSYCSCAVDS